MDSQEYEDGSFAVNISAGEYWVRAERFDGLYQPTYFDSDGDGNPDVVSVGTEPLELNLSLLPYPSATVTIKVVDERTGDAVPHVWFSFHGEDEELGSVVYPNLSEIDYESGEFDGNYTLNVPVGTYLVQAESEGYEPVMGILDESGTDVGLAHKLDELQAAERRGTRAGLLAAGVGVIDIAIERVDDARHGRA